MEKLVKYFIQTYGCQANVRDSQAMTGALDALGLMPTSSYKDADVIIVNSCSVRQKAEDKVYGWGLKLKDKKKNQIVFVTGCMIGSAKGSRKRYKIGDLQKKFPWADYLLAPKEELEIPSILVKEGLLGEWGRSKQGRSLKVTAPVKDWAYVNISTGCDNFCTFCVVPYARGKEESRAKEDILEEIRHLASQGYANIMLVGQNVNSWGLSRKTKFKLRAGSHHKIPFARLLKKVHEIDGVEKINFISSNPFDFTQDLIDALTLPKIDRYLHIAVQSGDNAILRKMNRRHTIEEFKGLVTEIKQRVPDMKFGTDIIVGFPGETEKQFMKTVDLFRWMKFDIAYIAMYSMREGTVAAKMMEDDIPLKEKKRRHAYLTRVWKESLK